MTFNLTALSNLMKFTRLQGYSGVPTLKFMEIKHMRSFSSPVECSALGLLYSCCSVLYFTSVPYLLYVPMIYSVIFLLENQFGISLVFIICFYILLHVFKFLMPLYCWRFWFSAKCYISKFLFPLLSF